MSENGVVECIKPYYWFAWRDGKAIGAYESEESMRRDAKVRQVAESSKQAPKVVEDYAFALGVVTKSPSDLVMHGLFNVPEHATDFAWEVGGELRLVRIQWAKPGSRADVSGLYPVDPERRRE